MKAFLVSDNHDSLVGMRLAGIKAVLFAQKKRQMKQLKKSLNKRILDLAITEKAAALA